MYPVLFNTDINTVITFFKRIDPDSIFKTYRWFSGARVVIVAVPGAAQPAIFDLALTQWPALVRAAVVQRAILTLIMGQRYGLMSGNNRFYPPFGQFVFSI